MFNTDKVIEEMDFSGVRKPLSQAETLPPACYTSEDFFTLEKEKIFYKKWNFVCREDELPATGDYASYVLFGEPIFLVRGQDQILRCFANTCSHRGARLVCDAGNRNRISCPYHSWTYGLDGALVGAPDMDQTESFDKSEHGLTQLRLENWEGFSFVNFDADAEPLAKSLGNLPVELQSYNFSNMECVRRKTYNIQCNWKIYIENAMEDYHTGTVHKSTLKKQETTLLDTNGDWDAIHMPGNKTIAVLGGVENVFPHIPSLEGRAAKGTYFVVLYPNTFFAITFDCMWWIQAIPKTAETCEIIIGSCFPKETIARPDFDEIVGDYYRRWDKALPEDNDISEEQQIGLGSKFSKIGRFSWREPVVHLMDNWILDEIQGLRK